ncbi:MAG: 4Fe-4S binding protein [Candidatus Thorarchaeota archaeon]
MAEAADKGRADQPRNSDQGGKEQKVQTGRSIAQSTTRARDYVSRVVGRIVNLRMLRRLVQVFFLFGINAYILGTWFAADWIVSLWQQFRDMLPTLPIIASLDAPYAVIAGSFDALQREFTRGVFPFFTIGGAIVILTVIGRSACGWICPIGTVQDFATLPNPHKIRVSPETEEGMRRVKAYVFVGVMFVTLWISSSYLTGQVNTLRNALGVFFDSPFNPLNPAHILFVVIPSQNWPTDLSKLWYLMTFGTLVWMQIAFVVFVVIVSIWVPRWYCRWLCPAGWFYGLFSKNAIVGIGRNPARCTPDTCSICEAVCPMNIRIRRYPYQHMYSPDCILCLECKSHCPNKAISVRFV